MKIQLVGIVMCMLLVIPVFATTVTADPGPEFKIEIKGGFGITAKIKNIGDENAYNVQLLITIERTNHYSSTGTEADFPVGVTVREHKKSWWIGSGHRPIMPAKIGVRVGNPNEPYFNNVTINALLVFRFVIPLSG